MNTTTDHLTTITPLLGIVARERTATRPELYDDARQEGMIRAWTVQEARPDAPREYVVAAAKRGINDVVRGRPLTGQEGRRGWQDAADSAGPLVRQGEDGEEFVSDPADPAAEDALAAVELVDVIAQVRAALEGLTGTDRIIAQLRAEGRDWKHIAPVVGMKTEACRRRFVNHLAPALRAELGHLRGLA